MPRIQMVKPPHTFGDIRDAVAALAAYVAEWSGYSQYEVRPVFAAPDRAVIGYQVRVMDLDGFFLAYLAPLPPKET